MALLGDAAAGLMFRIRADTDQAERQLTSLKKELKEIEKASKDQLGPLQQLAAQSGISAQRFTDLAGKATLVAGGVAAVATAAAATGVALFNLAKQASDFGSAIFDASEKTGLSAQTLSSLKVAAEQSGASLEQVTAATAKFARMVGDAADGSKAATADLKKFGLEPQEAINDLDGSLEKVFKRIVEAKPGAEQMSLAMTAFGRSGADLLPMLKSFDGDLEGLIERMKDLGLVITDETAKAADDFGDQMDVLGKQLEALKITIGSELMPVFTEMAKDMSGFISRNKDEIRDWGTFTANTLRGVGISWSKMVENIEASGLGNVIRSIWDKIPTPIRGAVFGMAGFAEGFANIGRAQQRGNLSTDDDLAAARDEEAAAMRRRMNAGGATTTTGTSGTGKKKADAAVKESSERVKALVEAAGKLGISPLDLATIISYETGGTFSPNKWGGKGGNYKGLIQFGPEERTRYGVTAGMSFEDQILGPVVKYFKDRFGKVGRSTIGANLLDLYKTVNGGNPNVSSNASDGNGTIAQHVARMATGSHRAAARRFLGGEATRYEREYQEKAEKSAEQSAERLAEAQKKLDKEVADNRFKLQQEVTRGLAAAAEDAYAKNLEAGEFVAAMEAAQSAQVERLNLIKDEMNELRNRGVELMKQADAEKDAVKRLGLLADLDQNRTDLEERRLELAQAEREEGDKLAERQQKIADIEKQRNDVIEARVNALLKEQAIIRGQADDRLANLDRSNWQRIADLGWSPEERNNARKQILDIDISAINKRADEQLRALDDEKARYWDGVEDYEKTLEAKLELDRTYAAKRKAVEEGRDDAIIGAKDSSSRSMEATGGKKKGGIGGFFEQMFGVDGEAETRMSVMQDTLQSLGNMTEGVMNQMGGAIGSLVESWVLLGDESGASMRKMTAAILAGLASQAAVQAVMELARGFALMFSNPAASSAHFTAAAIFGSVAAVAGLAGRALAGDSFKQQANRATGGSTATGSTVGGRSGYGDAGEAWSGSKPATNAMSLNDPNGRGMAGIPVNVSISVKDDSSVIGDLLKIDVERNGPARRLIQRVAAEA